MTGPDERDSIEDHVVVDQDGGETDIDDGQGAGERARNLSTKLYTDSAVCPSDGLAVEDEFARREADQDPAFERQQGH